ncbi:MAG: protease modulator HflC, partial [Gammaproteobacteria bacterium]
MTPVKTLGLAGALLLLLIVYICCYSIEEGRQGLLLKLGQLEIDSKTKKPVVNHPGLHFKLPIINQARTFDTRLQTLDIQSSRIVTVDQKSVIVDYYIKWRIFDLPLYFMRTGGQARRAQSLLEPQLNDSLRAEFGRRSITDVVSAERSNIMEKLQAEANKTVQGLGIQVVDVRIKRIDLPEEVSNAIYDQMRAAREKVATEHRAKGRALAEAIRAKA